MLTSLRSDRAQREIGPTKRNIGLVALAAATGLAIPLAGSTGAQAAVAPTIGVGVSGSILAPLGLVSGGCAVTVTATLTLPAGVPVPQGTVDFFDRAPGRGDIFLGAIPVTRGQASVRWIPTEPGQHQVSAGYYNGLPDILPVAGATSATIIPLGGLCF